MDKNDIRHLSWVLRGKQRREIIVQIEGPETPTGISSKSGYSLNHTSRILNELKRQGLAKLLNPKQKTGRLYVLTSKGKKIRDAIRKKPKGSNP
ncbi:MAG: winged helix-turn-helix domain-containing protein [Candidatus Woesearchaeota archaeon]